MVPLAQTHQDLHHVAHTHTSSFASCCLWTWRCQRDICSCSQQSCGLEIADQRHWLRTTACMLNKQLAMCNLWFLHCGSLARETPSLVQAYLLTILHYSVLCAFVLEFCRRWGDLHSLTIIRTYISFGAIPISSFHSQLEWPFYPILVWAFCPSTPTTSSTSPSPDHI